MEPLLFVFANRFPSFPRLLLVMALDVFRLSVYMLPLTLVLYYFLMNQHSMVKRYGRSSRKYRWISFLLVMVPTLYISISSGKFFHLKPLFSFSTLLFLLATLTISAVISAVGRKLVQKTWEATQTEPDVDSSNHHADTNISD